MPLLLGLPFLEIVGAFLIVGLIVAGRPLSEAIAQWLDSVLGSIPLIGHRIANSAVNLTRWLSSTLVQNSAGTLDVGARWVAGIALWAEVVIGNALAWPYWLLRFQQWLLFKELPRLIHALPNAAAKVVHAVTTRVVRVERTIVKFPKLSRAQVKALVAAALSGLLLPYLPLLRWLKAHAHALTAVLPHAIPLQWGRTVTGIRKRLARLERITAGGLAIAAVVAALARLGLGWIRCRKVGRVGRQLCGMDDGFLESLLLDAAAIFSIVSIVEFATELRAVEDEALTIMGKLVREWPG